MIGDPAQSGSDVARRAWPTLAWLATAELLAMTMWFSATAAGPALAAEFRLASAETAWLTMAVQAGFVAGTLVSAVLNLADVLNARWLFAIGCVLGSAANALVTTTASASSAILLRALTGAALAGVYPPGMKIAASWFDRRRGTALGILVGALTIGSAFPHLLAAFTTLGFWRELMLAASLAALVAAVLVLALVDDGPYLARTSPFDPRAIAIVLRSRGARLATFGYLGHMWELYAMWAWIAVFVGAVASAGGAWVITDAGRRAGALVAFAAISAGAAGCVAAGLVADRLGKARVAGWAMVVSAACALGVGFVVEAPRPVLYALILVWGFAVVADSAQFSALVSEYSPRDHVGTALTLQTCAGFLLTMVSIRLLPTLAAAVGWQWTFLALVPGPVLGALAMFRLALDRPIRSEIS